MAFIGQSVRRFEDARFLIGQGRYVADLPVEGALHMVVLRSPHAHARICRIDTAAAQAFVLTAGALAEGGIGRLPCPAQIGVPIAMAERPVLAEAVVVRPLWGEAARVSSLPHLRCKQTARVQK